MRFPTSGIVPSVAAVLLTMLALAACAVVQSGAPAVSPTMVKLASARGVTEESLNVGRTQLASRCTGCHVLEPVSRYPASEWPLHVRRMSARAGLSALQQKQIEDYLVSARESMDTAYPTGNNRR